MLKPTIDRHRGHARGHFKIVTAALIGLGVVVGVVAVAGTTWMVNATSSVNFCSTACHSMQWAAAAYERGPHYVNAVGVRASCGDCHIPFEDRPATPFQYVFGTLWTKGLDGTRDVYAKMRGTIADKTKWEAERPRLTASVESWLRATNFVTCHGCHNDSAFTAKGGSPFMAVEAHSKAGRAGKLDCLLCHQGFAHRYEAAAK